MTNLSDIIEACKNGEKLGRKILYEKFSTRMRAACYRYLGNESDTEDILHEGFIIVFTKINQFTGKGSFEGWMKRIFINLSLNHLKKRNANYISEEDIQNIDDKENQLLDFSDKKPDKSDLILRMDFSEEELLAVLQELPHGYKLVFNLFVFEKRSHKEIAELLSISVNTSKSQLSRARSFLQQKLYELSIQKEQINTNEQYKRILKIVV